MDNPVTASLLSTNRLRKTFGAIHAIDSVDLALRQNEIHAIIGPNGAGKTTLISLLSGSLKPDHGDIFFRDENISRLTQAQRAKKGLGRSFQITSVILPMTLLENVLLSVQGTRKHAYPFWHPVESKSQINNRAKDVLYQVGLSDKLDQPAAAVSHGEQRQLELAMVLAMQPELLLLDEPMAGMGRAESEKMTSLLKRIGEQKTILLIEHDMDAVFSLAQTISVLVQGKIIASDTTINIRANPQVQSAYLGESAS